MAGSVEVIGDGQDHVMISELKLLFNGCSVGQLASQACVEQDLDALIRVPLYKFQYLINVRQSYQLRSNKVKSKLTLPMR